MTGTSSTSPASSPVRSWPPRPSGVSLAALDPARSQLEARKSQIPAAPTYSNTSITKDVEEASLLPENEDNIAEKTPVEPRIAQRNVHFAERSTSPRGTYGQRPSSPKDGTRDTSRVVCYSCHKPGHVNTECPEFPPVCYNCQETGHIRPNCPKPRKDGRDSPKNM